MNAKARTARQIVKARRTEARDARRPHTLAAHVIRVTGLDKTSAGSLAGALRTKGKAIKLTGTAARMFRAAKVKVVRHVNGRKVVQTITAKLWRQPVKNARRFTLAQFRALVTAYNPIAPKNVALRAAILAAI